MLDSVRRNVSERKLRLFAVACCRRIVSSNPLEPSQCVIDESERYADGLSDEHDLTEAGEALRDDILRTGDEEFRAIDKLTWSNAHLPRFPDGGAVRWAAYIAYWAAATAWYEDRDSEERVSRKEQAVQSSLLRCMIGNPFRPATLNPSCLTADVVSLAQDIYELRHLSGHPSWLKG